MILIGFTMAMALCGLYFIIYEYPLSASQNLKQMFVSGSCVGARWTANSWDSKNIRQGLSLENYDLDWSYNDDESISDDSLEDEHTESENSDSGEDSSASESENESEHDNENECENENKDKCATDTNSSANADTNILVDAKANSTDSSANADTDSNANVDTHSNSSEYTDASYYESSESESEDEEREHQMVRKNRRVKITEQDLIDWGVERQIDEICQRFSRQLKTQCFKDLLENYLGDSKYKRNPTKMFRRFFKNRGHIQHLNIPEDLPLVALHRLHETPEYLDQLRQDRGRVHQQMIAELKRKFNSM